jgi:hypothetical protein
MLPDWVIDIGVESPSLGFLGELSLRKNHRRMLNTACTRGKRVIARAAQVTVTVTIPVGSTFEVNPAQEILTEIWNLNETSRCGPQPRIHRRMIPLHLTLQSRTRVLMINPRFGFSVIISGKILKAGPVSCRLWRD